MVITNEFLACSVILDNGSSERSAQKQYRFIYVNI